MSMLHTSPARELPLLWPPFVLSFVLYGPFRLSALRRSAALRAFSIHTLLHRTAYTPDKDEGGYYIVRARISIEGVHIPRVGWSLDVGVRRGRPVAASRLAVEKVMA